MVKALKRTVFVGTFRHSVDEKKRLAIPAKWRAAAKGAEFYVLPVPNDHLLVLPESAMDKIMDKVDDMSIGEYDRRNTLRLIAGGAHGTPVDAQGRIILTDALMKHADIEDEAALVGMIKGFEIWNPTKHQNALHNAAGNFAESAKQLGI